MTPDFWLARNDRAPITFPTGADLTGSTAPKLIAYNVVKQTVVTLDSTKGVALSLPPTKGEAVWTPDATGLTVGSYDLELEVTVNGVPVTYPSDPRDRPRLEVFADLG